MKIIYGSELSLRLKEELKNEVANLTQNRRKPHLAVILVGENPASISYVKGKGKASNEVGFDFSLFTYSEEVTQNEIEEKIIALNQDKTVDGILVQLPLPKHLNERKILEMIDPDKDVDGLHPINAGRLFLGEDGFVPCTPLGVMALLKEMGVSLEGKDVVVVGRSNLVGLPLSRLLLKANATVTTCHSKTQNLAEICKRADILIVAIGKARFITKDYIKEHAYVIDVGVNRVDGKLCGDVDFENVKDYVSAITPVPKGVGPMTITMLLANTLKSYKKREGIQ